MTVNKSQGQTFTKVAIYLPKPLFVHGQFYVAQSRSGFPPDADKGVRIVVRDTSKQGDCLGKS